MKGTAHFYTFAYLRQAAWNAFDTAKNCQEGANYHRVSAVLFAALSIEAHLNHVGEVRITNWNDIEKQRWKEKLNKVAAALNLQVDKSRRPIQTIIEVFDFRNKLAHGKTHSEELEYDDIEGNASEDEVLDPQWLSKYWTDDAVTTVLKDVEEVLVLFHNAAQLDLYELDIMGDGEFEESEQE
jgi:hypothetical protein